MTVKQAVLEDLEALPVGKQEEVLDFVQFLKAKQSKRKPRRSLQGSLAHLNIEWTEEDMRKARNEMWRGYTKDTENDREDGL
ncbi:MAG TPA: DUF2281 domain-containing protein [Pyrinomonadaceae bacterium]|nr:DUF2281 domain-containing protein [Pyrinomonadaceae bacterium]